jgi:hypothetical protein
MRPDGRFIRRPKVRCCEEQYVRRLSLRRNLPVVHLQVEVSDMRRRELFSLMVRAVPAALMCTSLAACAGTSALESQSKPISAQSARIYILRPYALSGSAVGANVKIDGAEVGSVAVNSHFFVDRPPGRRKIEVRLTAALAGVEHEADLQAGRTYYFAFNAPGATVMAGGVPIVFPGATGGRQVGQSNFFSNGHLAQLDEAAGVQMIAQMQARANAARAAPTRRGD